MAAATVGAVGVIGVAGVFLAQTLPAAASAKPVGTDRHVWYLPSVHAVAPAQVLDVSRSLPVKGVLRVEAIPDPAIYTRKVGVESLKVRSAPGPAAPQRFILKGGTPVKIGEQRNGWVEITTDYGHTGWVHSGFLTARHG